MTTSSDLNARAPEESARDVEGRRSAKDMRTLVVAMLACFAILSVGACGGGGGGSMNNGGNGGDDGGYGGGGNGDDDDDDGTLQATLASTQENVFTPICTQCHTGSGAPQGLRLEEGVSYGMLVNVASSEVPSLLRVNPGNPDDSYLIHKLEGTASVGDRMPQGGPFLSQESIDVIRQWITDGAAETANASAPAATKTGLAAGWPVDDSTLDEAPAAVTLIADGELDTSLLHAGSVQIVRLDDIDPATSEARIMKNVELRVSSLSPTVINLRAVKNDWTPGRYEVRVKGSGATPVADRAGRIIDGDDNGEPGGDFVLRFRIGSE